MVGAKQLSAPVALQHGLLLVVLAEGIGTEMAEGNRGLATHIAVMPGAFPLACRGKEEKTERTKGQLGNICRSAST